MADTVLCKDCKYVEKGKNESSLWWTCINDFISPKKVSPVDGQEKHEYVSCENARRTDGACGTTGVHFEQREE